MVKKQTNKQKTYSNGITGRQAVFEWGQELLLQCDSRAESGPLPAASWLYNPEHVTSFIGHYFSYLQIKPEHYSGEKNGCRWEMTSVGLESKQIETL